MERVHLDRFIKELRACVHLHVLPYNLGDEGKTANLIFKVCNEFEAILNAPSPVWVKVDIDNEKGLPPLGELVFWRFKDERGNLLKDAGRLVKDPAYRLKWDSESGVLLMFVKELEWLSETAQQAPEPVEENRCFECGELLNKEALFCGECRKQI